MRRVLAALFAAGALLVGSDSVSAAAPWFVMVHGTLLDEPVLLDDWDENLELMLGISETVRVEAKRLEGRPYLDVALFWGPDWMDFPRDPEALRRLSPEQANQQGRFYPAVDSGPPALFLFGDTDRSSEWLSARVVEPGALALFEAHGIPISIEQEDLLLLGRAGLFAGATVVLIAGMLVGVLVGRRRPERGVSPSRRTTHRR